METEESKISKLTEQESKVLHQFKQLTANEEPVDSIIISREDLVGKENWKSSVILKVHSIEKVRPTRLREWISKLWNPTGTWQFLDLSENKFLLLLSALEDVEKNQ